MFIIFGWNHIDSTEYGIIKEEYCAHCHNTEIWNLRKTKNYLTIFFIPIFPYESFNFYYCPICNYGIKLSKRYYLN